MVGDVGSVQVWNPDKQLSEQVTLKNIVFHDTAMKLARTGVPEIPSEKPLSSNDRTSLRFKGLNEIISAQQCIIINAKSIVGTNNRREWAKKYKSDENKEEHPFADEDNDYNELVAILLFLDECEQKIIKARQTKSYDDDFVWEKDDGNGEIRVELSPAFFEMMKLLEGSFESIYDVLINNKIVSSGIVVDEELDDKQKEEEMVRRVVEA